MEMGSAGDAPAWDAIEVGDELPELLKTPTPMQLFMFSAVAWNRHLIHYNTAHAVQEGLDDVAVQRSLHGAFIAQMVSDWLGTAGRIASLEWSVRGNAAINKRLSCRGRVARKYVDEGRNLIDCEVHVDNHAGELIVPGTVTVEFFDKR